MCFSKRKAPDGVSGAFLRLSEGLFRFVSKARDELDDLYDRDDEDRETQCDSVFKKPDRSQTEGICERLDLNDERREKE